MHAKFCASVTIQDSMVTAAFCAMQVRYVGEREVPERMSTEHLRTEERVVEETVTSPCSPLQCNGCVPTTRGVAGNGVSSALLPSPYLCCCLLSEKVVGFHLVVCQSVFCLC